MPIESPEELVHTTRLDEALASLKAQIRERPTDASRRFFLFQLQAILGNWGQALAQLNVAAELDANLALFAHAGRRLLQAEALREEVFAGSRSPMVLGEPPAWMGRMVNAARLLATGHVAPALEERAAALEDAPPIAGSCNGVPFSWLADADARLGPLIEAVVDARYYWIPQTHIARMEIEPPSRLRDLVWLPTTFVWQNEGVATGFLFARYPASQRAEDPAIRLARSTEWSDLDDNAQIGLGQRVLVTDSADLPLLTCREIIFAPAGDA